jgi:uncharacterized protein (DUF427 family)
MAKLIRIFHRPSNTLLAEGKQGWDITPFEGNYYIRKKCLIGSPFKMTAIPGLCPYKFIYLWLDLQPDGQSRARFLAWKYVIPNPLLPFIWFRTGIYGTHPDIEIQKVPASDQDPK